MFSRSSADTPPLVYSVVIAGIIRTVYVRRVQGIQGDKSWLGFTAFAAGIAESNLAIVCACAPSLKSVCGKFFRDNISSSASGRGVKGSRSGYQKESKSSRSERSDIVLVERSVEINNSPIEEYEHALEAMTSAHVKEEKNFGRESRGPISRTTEIRGGLKGVYGSKRSGAGRPENSIETPSFNFFPDEEDDQVELTHEHDPRGMSGKEKSLTKK